MALKTRYSPLQQFSLANVFNSYADLSSRSRMVALAVVGGVLLLLIGLPISLVTGKITGLKKEITTAQKGYFQVSEKVEAYKDIKATVASIEEKYGRPLGGSLSSRVESLARTSGLKVDIREKPNQETEFLEINSVEVRLSQVSLNEIIQLIHDLEADKLTPMQIRRLQMKVKGPNRQQMDASFDVATFTLKKEV
ncbi:MAG: hypothetical protein IPJ69_01910 [Deltaproteobacteria bacterium]|nr:MAG: hypothetical protein IPJ69_01910 [Deltaproteobacteria bacterium]